MIDFDFLLVKSNIFNQNLININALIINGYNFQIQCFHFEYRFYSTEDTIKNV